MCVYCVVPAGSASRRLKPAVCFRCAPGRAALSLRRHSCCGLWRQCSLGAFVGLKGSSLATVVAQYCHKGEKAFSQLWHDRITDVRQYHHDSATSLSLTRESCTRNVRISCHRSETTFFSRKGSYKSRIDQTNRRLFLFFLHFVLFLNFSGRDRTEFEGVRHVYWSKRARLRGRAHDGGNGHEWGSEGG